MTILAATSLVACGSKPRKQDQHQQRPTQVPLAQQDKHQPPLHLHPPITN